MTEQDILKSELKWGAAVAAAVGLIIGVVVVSSASLILHPPSNVETIDPATLHQTGEFVEANLGSTANPDGSVTARLVAAQYAFVPRCLAVPVETPVALRVTSPDVIHGFIVAGTNVNTMVIPGYVSQVNTVFKTVGDHLMPCHEYCGLGHSEMWSIVRVLPKADWHPGADGKVSCEIPG